MSVCKLYHIFNFCLRTTRPISTKIQHKASLSEGDSSLFKWRATPFSKGGWYQKSENTFIKIKNLFQNHWANFNQTWHKASLVEGDASHSSEWCGAWVSCLAIVFLICNAPLPLLSTTELKFYHVLKYHLIKSISSCHVLWIEFTDRAPR